MAEFIFQRQQQQAGQNKGIRQCKAVLQDNRGYALMGQLADGRAVQLAQKPDRPFVPAGASARSGQPTISHHRESKAFRDIELGSSTIGGQKPRGKNSQSHTRVDVDHRVTDIGIDALGIVSSFAGPVASATMSHTSRLMRAGAQITGLGPYYYARARLEKAKRDMRYVASTTIPGVSLGGHTAMIANQKVELARARAEVNSKQKDVQSYTGAFSAKSRRPK